MELIIVLVVIILLVLIITISNSAEHTKDQNTSVDSATGTTGNETYDFINDSAGVDLFDKE